MSWSWPWRSVAAPPRGGPDPGPRAEGTGNVRIFGLSDRITQRPVMAQRIPRDESLSRVHGVGALFSAAYGNVGAGIVEAARRSGAEAIVVGGEPPSKIRGGATLGGVGASNPPRSVPQPSTC